jgi:hypothetical protein
MSLLELLNEEIGNAKKRGYRGYKSEKVTQVSDIDDESLLPHAGYKDDLGVTEVTEAEVTLEDEGGLNHRKCYEFCQWAECKCFEDEPTEAQKERPSPRYIKLFDADIESLNPDLCVPGAFFLHAMSLVKATEDVDFENMRRRFVPHWRVRLEKEALAIVGGEIKRRLAKIKGGKGNGDG